MSLELASPTLVKPSDDYSLAQLLDYNYMTDSESESPTSLFSNIWATETFTQIFVVLNLNFWGKL